MYWEITIVITAAGMMAFLIFSGLNLLIYIVERKRKKKNTDDFQQDIISCLETSSTDLEWDQVKQIATTRDLRLDDINGCLGIVNREILTGKKPELQDQADTVSYFLDMHAREAPFEGLNSEVRVQLERIANILDDDRDVLDPLVENLKQYNEDNILEKRKHRRRGKIGLSLTAVGLLIAALSIFFTLRSYFSTT